MRVVFEVELNVQNIKYETICFSRKLAKIFS